MFIIYNFLYIVLMKRVTIYRKDGYVPTDIPGYLGGTNLVNWVMAQLLVN